jgi:hypothetical protein
LLKDIQRDSQEFLAESVEGMEHLDRNWVVSLRSRKLPASQMEVAAKSKNDWVGGINFELTERRPLVGADGVDELPETVAYRDIDVVGDSVG